MSVPQAFRLGGLRAWEGVVPLAGFVLGRGLSFVSDRAARRADAAPPLYKPHAGPFDVTAIDLTLRDDRRGKDLRVRAYAPTGAAGGPRPIIVVSHGLACGGTDLSIASRYWASHGFACLHPTHEDSNHLRTPEEAHRRWPGGLRRWVARNPQAWADRCADLSLVIDRLDEIERQLPAGARLDAGRVGVAGHSYGADMAQLIAGMRVVPEAGEPQSFADARVTAALVMAGSGRDALTPGRACWAEVRIPMMTMAGGDDRVGRRRGPAWREEPFRFSPPGDKYHLLLDDANHLTFTLDPADHRASRRNRHGPGAEAADPAPAHAVIRAASLAFWDAHLRGCPVAARYLRAGRIRTSDAAATVTVRCR